MTSAELRRQIHIQSEQRRRAQIKDGFDELRKHLPGCNNKKMSKAALLTRSKQALNPPTLFFLLFFKINSPSFFINCSCTANPAPQDHTDRIVGGSRATRPRKRVLEKVRNAPLRHNWVSIGRVASLKLQ